MNRTAYASLSMAALIVAGCLAAPALAQTRAGRNELVQGGPAPFSFACFERSARFAEFDRSRYHPRIEHGIVVTQFAQRARLGQALRDPRQQHFEMEWLGDDIVGARAKAVDRAGGIRAPRDEDHRNILETGFVAHQPGQFDPAHRRHTQFGQ